MEIKDVSSTSPIHDTLAQGKAQGLQEKDFKSLSINDSAILKLAETNPNSQDFRIQINEAINATHIATETLSKIDQLIKSVDGIIEQATDPKTPTRRLSVLEKEVNNIVEAIKTQAESKTPAGAKPLAGDTIRIELEKSLGKTLELILPDDGKYGFNLGQVSFSRKDSIIQTRASIEEAQRRIEQMKGSIDDAINQVSSIVHSLSVAAENVAASEASREDVDRISDFASSVRNKIHSDPQTAMLSIGTMTAAPQKLLDL